MAIKQLPIQITFISYAIKMLTRLISKANSLRKNGKEQL